MSQRSEQIEREIFEHLRKSRQYEADAKRLHDEGLDLRMQANAKLEMRDSAKACALACMETARELEEKLGEV
jgi:hypothetical protein